MTRPIVRGEPRAGNVPPSRTAPATPSRRLRLAGLDVVPATGSAPDRPGRLRAALLAWAAGGLGVVGLGFMALGLFAPHTHLF